MAMAGFTVIWTFTTAASVFFHSVQLDHLAPLEIAVVLLMYWVGFKGYQHIRFVYIMRRKGDALSAGRIPTDESTHLALLLQKSMEQDKLYLDPDLSLVQLAAHTQLNVKAVSAVLNGYLNKSFSSFVNEYRVEAVKAELLKPGNGHLTLFGIATKCGFSSQATFIRVFREFTGMPPSEFRKNSSHILI